MQGKMQELKTNLAQISYLRCLTGFQFAPHRYIVFFFLSSWHSARVTCKRNWLPLLNGSDL